MSETTYAPGDILKVTRTLRVSGPDWQTSNQDGLVAQDVKDTDLHFLIKVGGSEKIELVKKAVSDRNQKYKVGDLLTGKQVRAKMWKRGTVFDLDNHQHAVLTADGNWWAFGNGFRYLIPMENVTNGEVWILEYLP